MNLLEIEEKIKNGDIEVINLSEEIKRLDKDRFHYLVINEHLIREDKFYILCFLVILFLSIIIFLLYKNKERIKMLIYNIFFKIKNRIEKEIKNKNIKITLIHVLLLIIIMLLIILCFK